MDALLNELADMHIQRSVPMRTLTTFRLGGPADAVLYAQDGEEIQRAIAACAVFQIPYYVIGNGSNLIVRDGGIRGLVIVIGPAMAAVSQNGNLLTADAGLTLTALSREALSRDLQGLEWACGIPGTLGGACAMNAGAYGGEMKQVLKSIRVLENGRIYDREVQAEELGYRTSAYCAPERIVLAATLALSPDDGGAKERQAEYMARRREKQPLSYPSAGSIFKRPPGCYAGALIQDSGLKGARVGGAEVSTLHAGFIINTGDATADDVLKLIAHVKEKVLAHSGVELACEPKIWGEDAQ